MTSHALSCRALAALLVLAGIVTVLPAADDQDKKEDATKSGTVAGTLTAKAENWIEIKADGEEKPRRYYVLGRDQEMIKTIKEGSWT